MKTCTYGDCANTATREFCYPAEPWMPYCDEHEPQYATSGNRKIETPAMANDTIESAKRQAHATVLREALHQPEFQPDNCPLLDWHLALRAAIALLSSPGRTEQEVEAAVQAERGELFCMEHRNWTHQMPELCPICELDQLRASPGRTPIEDEALVASPHTTVFDTLRSTGEA